MTADIILSFSALLGTVKSKNFHPIGNGPLLVKPEDTLWV